MLLYPPVIPVADLPGRSALILIPQTCIAGGLWVAWRDGLVTRVGSRLTVPAEIWRSGLPQLGADLGAVWATAVPDRVLAEFLEDPPTTRGEALARIGQDRARMAEIGHGLLTVLGYALWGLGRRRR